MKNFLAAACFLFIGTDDIFNGLKQLSGGWKMTTANGDIYEYWNTSSDSLMNGKSFFVTRDTMLLEQVELKKEGKEIFYIPTVAENNNKPVRFKLVTAALNTFTFENKDHDFPQRIIYRIANKDSVVPG